MLHFIRERAQGWVAWFIVGLITIPFALWGVNSYLTGATDVVIATVDGEDIKQLEFQKALQQYRDRMRNSMGDSFDPELFDNAQTKQSILDELIEQKLLYSAARSIKLDISDKAIGEIIRATPAFQTEGQFDADRYKSLLARSGYSAGRYEQQLRADILISQLNDSIQKTALVTDNAIDRLLKLEKQKRNIEFGVIEAALLTKDITINDEEAVLYYEDNKQVYRSPERVSVNYVELSVDDLVKTIEVNDADLQQYYDNNKNQFIGPEQRRVSHILIEGDDDASLSTVMSIQQRLEQGEDFASLAAEFSADTDSGQKGGDLGLIERGVMDASFEETVFSMDSTGEVSEPVKTEFGYHLIKLTGIEKPEGKTFAEAYDEILTEFKRQQAQDLFFEKAESLANLSYENPDSLDIVAEDLDLDIKSSEIFTRDGGNGIAENRKVINVAFSDEVLVDDLNSSVIEIDKSHLVVLHKKEHVAESQLPFDVVSAAIKEGLKLRKARTKARELGEDYIEQLSNGAEAQSLFPDNTWQGSQTISRLDGSLNKEIIDAAFAIKKPKTSPEYSGFMASNGNYIVVKLNEVIEGDITAATQEDRDALAAYLVRSSGQNDLNTFINSLKLDADIEIMSTAIN